MKPGVLSLFVLCAAVAAQARVLSVGTYVANADREVVVPVMLSDAGELSGLGVKLTYDEKALEFVEAEPGSLSGVFDDDFTVSASGNGSVSVGLFASSNVNEGVSGSIARLRFRTRRGTERQFSDLTVANAQMIESSGVKDTTVSKAVSVVNGMIRVFGNGADVERLENAQTVCAGTELATLNLADGDGIAASTRGLTVRVPGGVAVSGKIPVQNPEEGWTAGSHEIVLLETSTDGLEFEPVGLGENDRFEVVKGTAGNLYRYTANVRISSDIRDPEPEPPEEEPEPPEEEPEPPEEEPEPPEEEPEPPEEEPTQPEEPAYEPGVGYAVTTNGYTWSFTVRDGKATIVHLAQRPGGSYYEDERRAVEPEPQGVLEIPAALGGCPVVGLGNYALYQCARIEEIRMPDTIDSVGEICCWGCGSLSNVVFSGALTNIGDGAFINCTRLRQVDFPNTLVSIGYCAFNCSTLERVFIPSSVRWIGDGAFSSPNGPGLIVTVDPTSQYFRSDEGALLSKDGSSLHTWPLSRPIRLDAGLRNIGIGVFWGNQAMRGESLTFPSTVTNVGREAFQGCGLREVNLNEGLVSIGQWAFAGNDLQSIVIPSSVGWMDMCVFDNCDRLLSVSFAGNAPAWVENDLYRGTTNALTTFVRPGSTGWTEPGSAELPEVWPVRGGEDARPIRSLALPPEPPPVDPVDPVNPVDPVVTNTITYLGLEGAANPNPATFTTNDLPLVLGQVEREGYRFLGWTPWDGVIPVGTASNVTFTANWEADDPDVPGVIKDPAPSKDEQKPVDSVDSALVYDGYVTDKAEIVGLVTVKAAKGGKISATVQLPENGSQPFALKKYAFKGALDKGGKASLACAKYAGGGMEITLCQGVASGTIGTGKGKLEFTARLGTKEARSGADAMNGKVWTVALRTASVKKAGAILDGYSALSIAGSKNGKVKVTGMMADGTKVSVTAQGMVFGNVLIVPVNVSLYKGKAGGFSLKLKLTKDGKIEVGNLSEWIALANGSTVTAAFESVLPAEAGNVKAGVKFHMDEKDAKAVVDGLVAVKGKVSVLPNGVPVKAVDASSGKWTLPKAGKVALVKGTTDLDETKFTAKGETDPNPAGLKLTFKKKTGLFSGSFQFYQLNGTKLKKLKATVNGAVVGGVGYGSAVIKNTGAMPVTVGK